jgi:hypothetical protein
VDGVIVLVVQQAMRVQSLSVAWKGEERVAWYQGATQSDLCEAQRTLFEHTTPVSQFTSSVAAANNVLQPGTYTYQVQWDSLPDELPPSFEDDGDGINSALPVLDAVSRLPRTLATLRSHIRYAATALLEFHLVGPLPTSSSSSSSSSSDKVLRLTRQAVLRVVERVSAAELLREPVTRLVSQSFLLSGAMRVEATLGNGGVLFAGQALFVRVTIKNGSGRSVDFVTLSLHETCTLKAHSMSAKSQEDRSFTHEFTRKRHVLEAAIAQSSIEAGKDWTRELMLPLPLSTAPSVTLAQHVRRIYELHVELEVTLGSNVVVILPVHVLGWSPLLSADLPAKVPVALDATKQQ